MKLLSNISTFSIFIFSIILLFSFCHSETTELNINDSIPQNIQVQNLPKDNNHQKQQPIKKVSSLEIGAIIVVPDAYEGFWANVKYIENLRVTKSTLVASMRDNANFYLINEDKKIMYLNIHDGAAENPLLLNPDGKGYITDPDTFQIYKEIEFKSNFLIIENNYYLKYESINQLINSVLFTGHYKLNNHLIEFKDNGEITGLEGILNYSPYYDYYDAGMNLDLIGLTFSKGEEIKRYIYIFEGTDLVIYEVECIDLDKEISSCEEIKKGKEFLRLNKIK